MRRIAEALRLQRIARLRMSVRGSGNIPTSSVGSGEIQRIGGDHHSHRAFRYWSARPCRRDGLGAPLLSNSRRWPLVLAPRFLRRRIVQDSSFHKLVASAALGQIRPVLSTLRRRVQAAVTSVVKHVTVALREATRPLPLVAGFATDLTRSRGELLAENTLLRQQLIVASRKVKRPAFRPHERALVVLLSRLIHNWRDAVLLAKPDTILRWHREGFRVSAVRRPVIDEGGEHPACCRA